MAPTSRIPQQKTTKTLASGPLLASELRALAPRRKLPQIGWRRLTLAFDHHRELFDLLREPDLPRPVGPVRNPFLAALGRLRTADPEGLPLRHRQALAQLDRPLALARLALEEANTLAWRQLDVLPLEQMVRWLQSGPLGRNAVADELLARALTYLALYLPRDGRGTEGLEALYAMMYASPDFPAGHELVFPQLLATALCWAPVDPGGGQGKESAAAAAASAMRKTARQHINLALLGAELWLGRQGGSQHGSQPGGQSARFPEGVDPLPELRAELALVRGALHGLEGEHLQAEAGYREAFAALLPGSDPFLRLLLCQEAAGALVNAALGQLEQPDSPFSRLLRLGTTEALAGDEAADDMAHEILTTLDAETGRFQQAATWLELAAPLLARHGNAEQEIRQQWLGALTRQFAEPDIATLELIAAFRKAHRRGRLLWLPPMANDLLVLAPRLRRLAPQRRLEVLRQFEPIARWLATSFDLYPTRHAASHPAAVAHA